MIFEKKLSLREFLRLQAGAVDPNPRGQVRRGGMNHGLTNRQLVKKMKERNKRKKPIYLLLLEYKRRLRELGPS